MRTALIALSRDATSARETLGVADVDRWRLALRVWLGLPDDARATQLVGRAAQTAK